MLLLLHLHLLLCLLLHLHLLLRLLHLLLRVLLHLLPGILLPTSDGECVDLRLSCRLARLLPLRNHHMLAVRILHESGGRCLRLRWLAAGRDLPLLGVCAPTLLRLLRLRLLAIIIQGGGISGDIPLGNLATVSHDRLRPSLDPAAAHALIAVDGLLDVPALLARRLCDNVAAVLFLDELCLLATLLVVDLLTIRPVHLAAIAPVHPASGSRARSRGRALRCAALRLPASPPAPPRLCGAERGRRRAPL
mmetsp:Transcript_1869/g.4702  ORF Transcript_1869/g.4702 Transcript_1869/m.4702 type:complete len:249 (+) Transcript_1869:140-886(+)